MWSWLTWNTFLILSVRAFRDPQFSSERDVRFRAIDFKIGSVLPKIPVDAFWLSLFASDRMTLKSTHRDSSSGVLFTCCVCGVIRVGFWNCRLWPICNHIDQYLSHLWPRQDFADIFLMGLKILAGGLIPGWRWSRQGHLSGLILIDTDQGSSRPGELYRFWSTVNIADFLVNNECNRLSMTRGRYPGSFSFQLVLDQVNPSHLHESLQFSSGARAWNACWLLNRYHCRDV